MASPLLQAINISKRFPGVVALDKVCLTVGQGEVHALLGENGAGKSTLLKILAGAHHQDAGILKFAGKNLENQSPAERQRIGIVTVYQEFNLVPNMSVAENIFLGREPGRANIVNWRLMFQQAKQVAQRLDLQARPQTLVRSLSVAEQQLVEIARALTIDAKLIILDEPTAALSDPEVAKLHSIIRDLKAKGISIIYVTHRLGEVWSICDRYTVLRDGKQSGLGDVSGTSPDQVIRLMVGRSVEYGKFASRTYRPPQVILQADALTRVKRGQGVPLHGIDLEIRKGEILGLAGLVGAGRTDLVRLLFGVQRFEAGRITLNGKPTLIKSPYDAIKKRIALVPEDRKQQGLFLTQSIRQNMTLPSLHRLCRFGPFVSRQRENQLIAKFQKALQIKMVNADVRVGTLSGGNQQKVILARCIALEPEVLIVDEPTRGIDIGAKFELHQLLRRLAENGTAVVIVSSELPEILSVCDRIVTVKEGRITGQMPVAEASEENLMKLMALEAGDTLTPAV